MKGSHFIFCINFKLNEYLRLFYSHWTRLTTHVPSRTIKTTSKVQSEKTQSLQNMSIRQLFTRLNCTPPIKFTSTRVRVLFSIYDSFLGGSPQCITSSTSGFPENVTQRQKRRYGREIKSESFVSCRGRMNIFGGSEKFLTLAIPIPKRCICVTAS